jgi:hypothetical protein
VGNRTDSSTQALGLTSFSEFAIGEIKTFTLSATATSGGTMNPLGDIVVDYGTSKTFEFTPDPTYHLADLFVDGVHVDSSTSYTFNNITANHTIHAVFSNKYKIVATAGVGGNINPSGDVLVDYDSNKTFTVTLNSGYLIDSLFVDGTHVDSTTSYTFYNVTANHTIHAAFRIKQFAITATASSGGAINPSGAVSVNYGEDKEFSIEPNTGYNFDSLFVDGIHVDSTTSYTFYNVTASHTIHAKFVTQQFTITATASSGGTISPSGVVGVNYGENKHFTIAPNTGYIFDSLFVDGTHVDSTTSYTFYNIEESHTIHAKFATRIFAITATAGTGGTINPSGVVSVNYGEDKQFTIAPNTGYNFDSLFVDGTHVDSTTSYTFKNVTATHNIHAVFVIKRFTVTASAGTGGTITPSGSVQVSYGDSIRFTMNPQVGYIVDSVFVDGSYVDNDTVYTIENVTANHTIHATFTFGEGVKDKQSQIPKEFALHQNYPNPFNPTTMIQIDLPQRSAVTLKVYNLLGAEVITLIDNKIIDAGIRMVEFNSQNLASGLYLYRIAAEGTNGKSFVSVKRMILLK